MDPLSATVRGPSFATLRLYPDGVETGTEEEGELDAAHDVDAQDDQAPQPFWSTPKVVGLLAVVVFFAVLLALALQSRFDGEAEDSVDVGFMQDMIYHHEQAIQLGLIAGDGATDDSVRHFAQEAIVAQQWEVGYMTALLEDWGYGTGSLDRDSMAWMGHPTSLETMPGIIAQDQMDAYRLSQGSDVDRGFIELMRQHHLGGIHMARDAATEANDPRVRDLAARMAKAQTAEIAEYDLRAEQLGFDL